jgi:hypothetical protein
MDSKPELPATWPKSLISHANPFALPERFGSSVVPEASVNTQALPGDPVIHPVISPFSLIPWATSGELGRLAARGMYSTL